MLSEPVVRAIYDRFFAEGRNVERPWHGRRECTSIGWPTIRWCAAWVQERRTPPRVLDLGSGLTTIVLHHLLREGVIAELLSSDTSRQWLAKTQEELTRGGLNGGRLLLQNELERLLDLGSRFDLIVLDLGTTMDRVRRLPQIVTWLAEDGTMLLDDWHMQPYRDLATVCLSGFAIQPLPGTRDEFGRFAATATREGTT